MSYLAPSEFVTKMVDAGESKVFMSTRDTIIRAYSFDKLKWVNEPVKTSGAAAADKKKKTVAVIAVTITKCKRNGPIGAIFRSHASESLVALS